MYFLQTTDVELTSVPLNLPVPEMAPIILKIGLPRILDLYSEFDVESTFFCTGDIVELEPEIIDIVRERGHEIGSHGYTHFSTEGFDVFPIERQIEDMRRSKTILEREGSGPLRSFRSPEARISEDTIRALEVCDFRYDSSVCPQRIDGPFSYGFRQKKKWIIAPRRPYRMSYSSFVSEGSSQIIEIPISSFLFPFIGTTMRIHRGLTNILRRILFFEAAHRNVPVVFLFHPNECIEVESSREIDTKYSGNYQAMFSGSLRTELKMRNLGRNAMGLMGDILRSAKKNGFEFCSIENYGKHHMGRAISLSPT